MSFLLILDLIIRFSRYDGDETFLFHTLKHFCFKNAFIFKRFCIDYALGNFVSSFLSRLKYFLLSSRKFVCKHPIFVRFAKKCLSGDGEIRTLDPLLARQVLSQLSYAPISVKVSQFCSSPSSLYSVWPFGQWAWEDSNFRPHAYQACALTGWATSP